MPVYVFACAGCEATVDLLLPLGDTAERPCDACGAPMQHRFGRVAVRYQSWGFSSTDRLLPGDRRRGDFRTLREKAEQIAAEQIAGEQRNDGR